MEKLFLVVCVIFVVTAASAGTVENIGCHKILKNLTGCQYSPKEEENQTRHVIADGLQWLRNQPLSTTFDVPSLSWIMGVMITIGYVNDKGTCTNTLQPFITKINSLKSDDVTSLSGGKLALYMIGLRASCQNVRNYKGVDLVRILKLRMKAFPKEEFNNFYQYSLGVLALYVNGENVPSIFGDKILRGVFLGKKKKQLKKHESGMTDTESLAIMALSALDRQTFVSHWVRRHIRKEKKKAKKKIIEFFRTAKEHNLITSALLLQSLQVLESDLHKHTKCGEIYKIFMSKQSPIGSFGDVMTTTYVLLALNGQSILNLRQIECPMKKDLVDEHQLKKFVNAAKQREENFERNKNVKNEVLAAPKRKVIVRVIYDSFKETQMVQVADGANMFDVLTIAATKNPCFHHVTKSTAYGKQITTICKREQNHAKRMYWVYDVNGKFPSVGAGKYKVKNGDIVTFSYKKF